MISVITPHFEGTNPYIRETYESLCDQTLQDWQWVVVLNNGGKLPAGVYFDKRVKVVDLGDCEQSIGMLKRTACSEADGEYILELDADDLLTPDALEETQRTFDENPEAVFAYSNTAEFRHGTWESKSYSSYWGWRSRPFKYKGHDLVEMIGFPPIPHALRMVWWAPNHLRAWRADDYWEIGGHNPNMEVIDDHELCCRFYLHGPMVHINQCLYLYRVHGENTCIVNNQAVTQESWNTYSRFVYPMAKKWAEDTGTLLIDLGAGHNPAPGLTGIDLRNSDITADLSQGIPLPDNSVGLLRAQDILEHLKDPVHIMNEAYRVLVPGGWFFISVPSTDGRGAFQDPGHVSFWNENSFWYYTDSEFAKYASGIECRFQVSRVITWFPSEWHQQHNISYADAHLIALKDGYHPIGEVLWQS